MKVWDVVLEALGSPGRTEQRMSSGCRKTWDHMGDRPEGKSGGLGGGWGKSLNGGCSHGDGEKGLGRDGSQRAQLWERCKEERGSDDGASVI